MKVDYVRFHTILNWPHFGVSLPVRLPLLCLSIHVSPLPGSGLLIAFLLKGGDKIITFCQFQGDFSSGSAELGNHAGGCQLQLRVGHAAVGQAWEASLPRLTSQGNKRGEARHAAIVVETLFFVWVFEY